MDLTKAESRLLAAAQSKSKDFGIMIKMLYALAGLLFLLGLVVLIRDHFSGSIGWTAVLNQFATQMTRAAFLVVLGSFLSFQQHAFSLIKKLTAN